MQRLCRACGEFHDLDQLWPARCHAHFRARGPRSSLAFPMVVSDAMAPIQSMADGQFYDSKAALREHYRDRGVIEIGNEIPAAIQLAENSRPRRPKISKADIHGAVQKVRQGYKPRPMTVSEFKAAD